ncbi:Citrate lyase gamma chain, acyl carrier protein [Clostridiaceae bacterium JG1575]|nr:Citrate lyase gamma chain, acyl carrier protein [Clostridiaceae bacterium JG1575]
MKLNKPAQAGSLESNDILISLFPSEELTIELTSPVKEQFGEAMEAVIRDTLKELDVPLVRVVAQDKGALDFAIRARVKTAVSRGMDA